MGFVGKDDGVIWDVFEQRRRRLTGRAPREVAGIILDPVAHAGGFQHFEVEIGALFKPLRLEQLALAHQLVKALAQLGLDALDRLLHRRARRDVVGIGVDADLFKAVGLVAGQRIELGDAFQFLAEKRQFPCPVIQMRGPNLEAVTTHPETAALKGGVVAAVLLRDQIADHLALVIALPGE